MVNEAHRYEKQVAGTIAFPGRVLPIGGLKEKLLAAIRNGMEKVLLPKNNEPDWYELDKEDKEIRELIKVEFVENAGDVFASLFGDSVQQNFKKKSK